MIKKTSTKENPLTTFRKNFETRTKTVMSSLKKAQNGIAVNDEMNDDLINKAGSTGGYKKPMKKYYPWDTDTKISPERAISEKKPKFMEPTREANLEAEERSDTINRLNDMHPNYKLNKNNKMLYTPPPTRVKAKGGPVKTKMKVGGATKATAADRIAGAKKNASKKK